MAYFDQSVCVGAEHNSSGVCALANGLLIRAVGGDITDPQDIIKAHCPNLTTRHDLDPGELCQVARATIVSQRLQLTARVVQPCDYDSLQPGDLINVNYSQMMATVGVDAGLDAGDPDNYHWVAVLWRDAEAL